MNYKSLGLLAMMAWPTAATAQSTTLQYSEGIFSGNVTLSAPLPEDGTFSVSPTEFNFPGMGAGYNYLCPGCGYSLYGMAEFGSASFAFTTDDGKISAWGIAIDFSGTPGTNTQTSLYAFLSPKNDSFTQQTFGAACAPPPGQPSPCHPFSVSSSTLGVWTEKTTSAPEIDPASAASALTLLFGGLAVQRGRRKTIGAQDG